MVRARTVLRLTARLYVILFFFSLCRLATIYTAIVLMNGKKFSV